jgi:hypothetical protein
MARFFRLTLAALSTLALSTTAGSALADAAAGAAAPEFVGCNVAFGIDGMSRPSNAPALLVNDRSNRATATASAELVSTDGRAPLGAPAKDTHGLLVATLPTSTVGSHKIATKVVCSDGSPESAQETSLLLTAPVEFPTAVGTLTVRPSTTATGVETVAFEASPGVRAFASVVALQLSVNGKAGLTSQGNGLSEQFSVNTGSVCVENGALHREKRTVSISLAAHIAGVAQSPTAATLDIPVDCGAIKWTNASDFDGSKTPASSSSEPLGSTDGTTPVSSTSGCSAAPNGLMSGGSGIFAAATALALLAGLRRRRAH